MIGSSTLYDDLYKLNLVCWNSYDLASYCWQ